MYLLKKKNRFSALANIVGSFFFATTLYGITHHVILNFAYIYKM